MSFTTIIALAAASAGFIAMVTAQQALRQIENLEARLRKMEESRKRRRRGNE